MASASDRYSCSTNARDRLMWVDVCWVLQFAANLGAVGVHCNERGEVMYSMPAYVDSVTVDVIWGGAP